MDVFLGTALWGWGVDRATVFRLLDRYYESGGRLVDTAANYPINGSVSDFGAAPRLIRDWLAANPGVQLGVLHKIGSVNNLGGPETALTPSDLFVSTELASGLYGSSLATISIHWDNRDSADEISATVETLLKLADEGFEIGFSGVKRPDLYRQACGDRYADWRIQVKENAATQAARDHYTPHFPKARYIAYGINMGGIKLTPPETASSVELRGVQELPIADALRAIMVDADQFEPRPESLNHLALALTWSNPALSGAILGSRNLNQLNDNISFVSELEAVTDLAGLRQQLLDRLPAS